MVTATPRKNIGTPMPKQNDDSYLQEDQEPLATCCEQATFFCI